MATHEKVIRGRKFFITVETPIVPVGTQGALTSAGFTVRYHADNDSILGTSIKDGSGRPVFFSSEDEALAAAIRELERQLQ